MLRRLSACIIWAFASFAGPSAFANPYFDQLTEEDTFLDVSIAGKGVRLEALVVRPRDATGRLPVALITHGRPASQKRMLSLRAAHYGFIARDIARRGYLTVVVIRRGFGRSEGPFPYPMNCDSTVMKPRFEFAADDLQAVMERIAQRPDADAGRVIAIGASTGGMAVIALGARNPPGLRAVINVSGGLRFRTCPKEELLVDTVAAYGKATRVPNLWLYAENDSYFPPLLAARMHGAFAAIGGQSIYATVAALPRDGHLLFTGRAGRSVWLPRFDEYLRSRNLPGFAPNDAGALLQASALPVSQTAAIERYLAAPGEKAFAFSPKSGRGVFAMASRDISRAREEALRLCQQPSGPDDCRIVLVNLAPPVASTSGAAVRSNEPARSEPFSRAAEISKQLRISPKANAFIESYLKRAGHKALARSTKRETYSFTADNPSIAVARERTLARCAQKAGAPCLIIMEDNRPIGP